MREELDFHAREFRKQIAAGVPIAMGSDVGPFPHGTQAREFSLMVKYGIAPLAALQAGTLNGAKLLGWEGQIGALEALIFRRHRRGSRQPAHRHQRIAESHICDERRRRTPQVMLIQEAKNALRTLLCSPGFTIAARTRDLLSHSIRFF